MNSLATAYADDIFAPAEPVDDHDLPSGSGAGEEEHEPAEEGAVGREEAEPASEDQEQAEEAA